MRDTETRYTFIDWGDGIYLEVVARDNTISILRHLSESAFKRSVVLSSILTPKAEQPIRINSYAQTPLGNTTKEIEK